MVSDCCEGSGDFVSEHVVVLLNGQWMESRCPGEEGSFQCIVPIHAAGYIKTRLGDNALHCSTRVRDNSDHHINPGASGMESDPSCASDSLPRRSSLSGGL